ncbi:aminodeoxychorismate lyase [Cytobacillus solani]|uniref:4-amino-4-deoxychorismate lyase n=1 Tax=Cytobacillus solani TaxID=1637975 RepID=A0A0Q3T5G3_9BACI|nr:aminodeoxychorismate lyase [Cytobacillus solani]KQL27420.1 4-amino-4-deoxychorismate lyase [Cytobacillus solani]
MFIYMNGKIVGKEEAVISPFDHGYLYGMGLFETFRVYDGHPFLLDDHLERLNNSLEVLNMKVSYSREEIQSALRLLLAKNRLTDAYIRLNVSAGVGEIGLQPDPYLYPNLIIFAKPLPPSMIGQEKKAVILTLNRNTPEGVERLKSHHYLNNILAKREIGDMPECEGIFLTKEGFLAEGIVSNLFWLKENVLYTPAIETGILNGITRKLIIKLAQRNGIAVEEGFFQTAEAKKADEIFVTNSIQEIVPIYSFAGSEMPGNNGGFVQDLQKQYKNLSGYLWSRNEW